MLECPQDTLVRDPFFKQMPSFFNMTFEQLMRDKHPTAWIEFETGWWDSVGEGCTCVSHG